MKKPTADRPEQTRPVTIADVATRCGVSNMTVSRILRDDFRYASKATIARVKATAEEMGYDPMQHITARRLVARRHGQQVLNRVIAFVLPGNYLKHPFYGNIVTGALDVMLEERFGLLISHESGDPETVFPDFLGRGDVDGLISYGTLANYENALPRLRRKTLFGQRPVVFLNRKTRSESSVVFDDFAGGYALAAHLLDAGHRHVLHLYEEASYAYAQRLAGCRQAYRDRNLDPDLYLHNLYDALPPIGERTDDLTYKELPAILRHTQATAVIARYDQQAQNIYQTLRQIGLRVPEDISLVGYNDTDTIFNEQGGNILTTVRLPVYEMGEQAARLVIQRVTGQLTEDTHIMLPVELVVRQSVAPPSR